MATVKIGNAAPGRAGMLSSLTSIQDHSALEKQLIGWPVPAGMSSKLVGTEESVTLNKGSGGYGITMVSNGQGLFVQDVAENGPGHLAGAVTGMRIIEIEGTPADMLAQRDAQQLMSGTSSITIKVIYDPKGYAATDFGAEMRRISQYAFQGDWHNDLPCVCSAIKYMGVQAFPNHRNPGDLAPLVKKALARLAQASDASFRASRTHNDNLHLGAAALVALSEDRTQSLDVRPHMLIDCVTIDTEGKAFAIVTNDTIQRETSRMYRCHVYMTPSAKDAQTLKLAVFQALRDGFDRVARAVEGSYAPNILKGQGGLSGHGSGSGLPGMAF